MIPLLIISLMCVAVAQWLPILFGLKSIILVRILCTIALAIWSIGWFSGGVISIIKNLDVMKIEHKEDGKDIVTINLMLGNAVIYKRVIPERKAVISEDGK